MEKTCPPNACCQTCTSSCKKQKIECCNAVANNLVELKKQMLHHSSNALHHCLHVGVGVNVGAIIPSASTCTKVRCRIQISQSANVCWHWLQCNVLQLCLLLRAPAAIALFFFPPVFCIARCRPRHPESSLFSFLFSFSDIRTNQSHNRTVELLIVEI